MESQNYIKEKELDNQGIPITADKLVIILELIKNSICDIKCLKEGHGTGFFCRIPYPDFFNLKPVLITSQHVLEENDLIEGKKIEFTLDHDKIKKEIIITNKRKVYSDPKFDVTIIELDPSKDLIEPNSFIDIDTKIFCEDPNSEFLNKDIYIIGNIKEFTHGKIKAIDVDGKTIQHLCSTKKGMSGSPIINLNNDRIFGIHNGAHPSKKWNLGTFLKEPIKQFYEKKTNLIKKKNEDINDVTGGISLEIMQILIEKMKRQICKIECGKKIGTGFFCNIHYENNISLKVLITANCIVNENDILVGKIIKFSIDNKDYKILIDESRIIYSYEITIIEIKDKDELKDISFFDIDNRNFKNYADNFKCERIYLLYYEDKIKFSDGIIKETKDNIIQYYACETDFRAGGAPLINSTNFQVIGINIGGPSDIFHIAITLNEAIKKFSEKYDLVYYIKKENGKNIKKDKSIYFYYQYRRDGISLEKIQSLIEKMKRQICKFEKNDGGTGFFCNIIYGYNKTLKVLITNDFILKKCDILIGNKIKLFIDNKPYEILLDKSRKIYTNEEYHITIIEIKDKDELTGVSFFDINYKTFSNYNMQIFKNKQIYLLYYKDKMKFSYGKFLYIKDYYHNTFLHLCLSESGSAGGPLLDSNNLQVIGIHIGIARNFQGKYGMGVLLQKGLEDFIKK